jgi:hypothetical protein
MEIDDTGVGVHDSAYCERQPERERERERVSE